MIIGSAPPGSATTAKVPATTAKKPTTKPGEKTGYARLDRATFNKMAVRLNQPVYWVKDTNKDGVVDPGEVTNLLFYPTEGKWVDGGKFTEGFASTYEELVKASTAAEPTGEDSERLKKVLADLDGATSAIIHTSQKGWTAADKTFYGHMSTVAKLIDELYETQSGVSKIKDKVAADAASQSLFRRNRGPKCATPKLEKDEGCTAAPGVSKVPVDIYPEGIQGADDFCEKKIAAADNKKALMETFGVVREEDGKLVAKGYNDVYGEQMKKIADELRAAAKDMTDADEAALVEYLNAAAGGFETNKWWEADEAWAKMSAQNSKWYVRVGPDETYWEPCATKGGFHLTFARINPAGKALQDKISPHIQLMEDEVAKLTGDAYKARKVSFRLPDAIDIVLNAGDDRSPIGGTAGQSLPNLGPVKDEGRSRTMVMTNLYQDEDSLAVRRAKASSILSADNMKDYNDEGGPGFVGVVLHEATHNLGPSHEINGKKDSEVFGGDLAAMLEELKAQSGAYYYLFMMQEKGVFTEEEVRRSIVDDVVWSMNHISRGMWAPGKKRKAYSQLAAIHVGFFLEEGALKWDPEAAPSAGGADKGAFTIDFAKMKDASVKLMKTVATIKAKGDKKGALELADKHVDEATSKVPFAQITERMLRYPSPNFVYAVTAE